MTEPASARLSVENVPRPPSRPKPRDVFEKAWPWGTREPAIGSVVLDRDGWPWQRRVDDTDAWESLRTWYDCGDGYTSVKSWAYLQEQYGPLLLLTRAVSADGDMQDDVPLVEYERQNLAYAMNHPRREPRHAK